MSGFIDRMFGRNEENDKRGSSAMAKDRLQFVLVHDRVNLPPERMRELQMEILAVIKRYVPEIEEDSVAIAIEQTDRYQNKIVAEIPFTKKRANPAADVDGNDDLAHDDDETHPNNSYNRAEVDYTPSFEPEVDEDDATHPIDGLIVLENDHPRDDD